MLNSLFPYSLFFVSCLLAGIFSFLTVIFLGKYFINFIKKIYTNNQAIQEELPQNHKTKIGTPTMGGILIIFSTLLSTALFANILNPYILITLFCGISFGIIGFADDYKKVKRKTMPNSKNQYGLSEKTRLIAEFGIAGLSLLFIYLFASSYTATVISIPFFNSLSFNAGIFYYLFAAVVIVGSSNAVNITDGLDGLATKTSFVSTIMFGIIAFLASNILLSSTHNLIFTENAMQLLPFIFALCGSLLGFLFFNTKPASIFMGDVGSLFLGGVFGILCIILKCEFLYAIFGFVFVSELGSSFIQKTYYKMTKVNGIGKRVFKMAPLHHHFEQCNWVETKIVERFFIFSIILACIASLALFIK